MRAHWLKLLLFATSCVTTWWFGGIYFSATLMGILVCHEFGHYFVGRHHAVDMSLPYFIPLPPQFSMGTMGAVIRMGTPIDDRNKLFDVGASGPIAGLIVAIPLLVIGLSMSTIGPSHPGDNIEGPSILYILIKYAMYGRWLPSGGVDVQLHPMAFAAWVGLLITFINLLPIGQLDGGHVARALLGQRHERLSGKLHLVLPMIGLAVGGVMFGMALNAGQGVVDALSYASYGAIPWSVWALMLAIMRHQGGVYHPPVGEAPLDPARRWRAFGMLVVFLLIATPVPFRPAL